MNLSFIQALATVVVGVRAASAISWTVVDTTDAPSEMPTSKPTGMPTWADTRPLDATYRPTPTITRPPETPIPTSYNPTISWPPVTPYPTDAMARTPDPASPSPCDNDAPDWVDFLGYGCDWYEVNDMPGCPYFGNGNEGAMGVANDNCCYCAGTHVSACCSNDF